VPSALRRIKEEFDSIDHLLFEDAVTSFFRESDPQYDAINVNGIMKVHDYSEMEKGDYGGEKSYVMAEMIPTSMAQYCIQWNVDM
jgi:hypothetical protein